MKTITLPYITREHTFYNKTVFLRADLNIPLKDGTIINDFKLANILPTIDYILEREGKIVLATHLGKPDNADTALSTKQLIPWFEAQGHAIAFCDELHDYAIDELFNNYDIVLLENLRFFAGEKSHDSAFAQQLAQLADYYVNDAFGTLHRTDTSMTLLCNEFNAQDRAFGLLVAHEIHGLDRLRTKPYHPYILVCGGSKLSDKIDFLRGIIKRPLPVRPQKLLLGGALAHPFLMAKNIEIGLSLCEQESIIHARTLLDEAWQHEVEILLPVDVRYVTLHDVEAILTCAITDVPQNGTIIDIGPHTITLFDREIAQADTIFANGTMGMYTNPAYVLGTYEIIEAIANATAYTVIGGGDAIAATFACDMHEKIDMLSTGGGATLAYLACATITDLPGIQAMLA